MKRKNSFLLFFMVIIIGSGIFTLATATPSAPKGHNGIDPEPIDIGPALRRQTVDHFPDLGGSEKYDSSLTVNPAASSSDPLPYYVEGTVLDWYGYDINGGTITLPFELRGVGADIEIWVALDLSFPDDREVPVITDDQVMYMIDEFDNNIYPTDTTYFGQPDFLDGSSAQQGTAYLEPTGRNVMLVSNIRDDNYYDATYPYYIVGFYWGVMEQAFDRNIISIDCADWANRVGDDVARPNLYEGVIAHEYQHLIHDDYNTNDDTFMNEGCSMYAEPLCGYGVAWGDIEAYLATPDNSLINWEDQTDLNILADYGSALMWTVYLSDHYGGAALISYFVQSGVAGVTGINQALGYFGYTETFDDVYHDWRIANLIHTDTIGGGKYDYTTFDLDTLDPSMTRIYELGTAFVTDKLGTDFGETLSYLGDPTGVDELGSYGSDYVKFDQVPVALNPQFSFNGDDAVPLTGRKTVETDFIVTLIGVDVVNDLPVYTAVETLTLDDSTETTLSDFSLAGLITDGYVLMVVSTIRGLADYSFSIEQGSVSVDTEDPVVSIIEPLNGATVADTISIGATATDNIGVSYTRYCIDGGVWVTDASVPYAWNWDTTTASNGVHSIIVQAYDAAGNFAEDSISVTVDNGGSGEIVYVEEIYTGDILKKQVIYFAFDVQPGMMTATVEWANSYDIDLYICATADITNALVTADGAANPESCSYDIQTPGTYYVAVYLTTRNAKTTAYSLTVGYYTMV